MVAELLLEIGTEEIPSGYLEPGLKAFKELAEICFKDNRIEVAGGIHTYGTPRRLVLIGKSVTEEQEDLVQEMTGPPKKIAFDESGKPTRAAMGFASKNGIPVESIEFIDTPKGEYLYCKTLVKGRAVREILADAIPEILSKIPWPKSMRWGAVNVPFVRPVQWVLAIMNGDVIPFEFAGVKSGDVTWGHRFMKPAPIQVSSAQNYIKATQESYVLINQKEREDIVAADAKKAAESVKGVPADDPDLISTTANLVEFPSAVCGGFDPAFLKLPAPVLITAMKKHQKYFAVYDAASRLLPNFVAINNTIAKDPSVVQKGHERVLRARLSDADFFYREDQKRSLMDRMEDLKGVIYQADLGTSYEKVQRFTRLAEYLAEKMLPEEAENVKTAAALCKCDLVTHMVTEFPNLQGVMGKAYAEIEKYSPEVCQAIHDHYLPNRAEGDLPVSKVGAIVSLADRMDSIAGCFCVGLAPSGNTDPFALRRHALAIIRILEHLQWNISLHEFIERALSILNEKLTFDKDTVFHTVLDFFRERYRHMLLRSNMAADPITAIVSVDFDNVCELRSRIDALVCFSEASEEFPALTATYKRIANFLKKQTTPYDVSPDHFVEKCETVLWQAYLDTREKVDECLKKKAYYDALNVMVSLRKPVDDLFDGVEVLTKEDDQLRENRVGLLQQLSALFLRVADFSRISA